MNKLDYLKTAIKNKCHYKRTWITSLVAVVSEPADAVNVKPYPYKLIQTPTGYVYLDANLKPQAITSQTKPLFAFSDSIELDPSWLPNIQHSVKTTVGNLLFNAICIVPAFGAKLPYQTGRQSASKIEAIIAPLLRDNVPEQARASNAVYVDEYLKFVDSLAFIRSLAPLCAYSATPTNVTSRPGFAAFKQALVAEYGDSLKDPVMMAEFESKLQAFDDEYLKDDPSAGRLIAGKTRTARKQLMLDIGIEAGFTQNPDQQPILNSLEEGWPTDGNSYTDMLNAARVGSYSRGKLTQLGGYAAKVVMRATNAYKITDTDCGTSTGIHRMFSDSTIHNLVGREIKTPDGWLSVKDKKHAAQFANKQLIVRSPMYCKERGYAICAHCAGTALSLHPEGIIGAMADITSQLLNASMKAMHSNQLAVAEMSLADSFT